MTWFIVGELSNLGVTDVRPRIVSWDGGKRILWPVRSKLDRLYFPIKRGRAEEFRAYFPPHERVVARVLPEDAEPEALRLMTEIDDARKALAAAETRLREFLVAQVPRGALVKASEAEPREVQDQ